ncbi:hypothetical protein TSTA_089950 [Talaromyces stipitatus ATCC 10500]|uniref:1,3-beta-glucanosyltransferase n=1 Tax=Talaromyces stipitatus (strain ATCC 10500 / CBS 375.48 / QM 6759 / NRRL 1006) TaxID=441959 RepID=B8M0X6_TALSN|nr:uncharacterized protein TSTA_089950 [Talaromyces stipitatus ATCC 10500]EED21756.1 hypothetical protein TSTA_089950 [Talaromyces stipitatus ATCC 10500]
MTTYEYFVQGRKSLDIAPTFLEAPKLHAGGFSRCRQSLNYSISRRDSCREWLKIQPSFSDQRCTMTNGLPWETCHTILSGIVVAYIGDNSASNIDTLTNSNAHQCAIDAPIIKELGANAISVHYIDPAQSHDKCMQAFQDNEIYIIATWQGSEIILMGTSNQADLTPFLKGAVRDMKAYVVARQYRNIPIGYYTSDDDNWAQQMADYLVCGGSKSEAIDFLGVND